MQLPCYTISSGCAHAGCILSVEVAFIFKVMLSFSDSERESQFVELSEHLNLAYLVDRLPRLDFQRLPQSFLDTHFHSDFTIN